MSVNLCENIPTPTETMTQKFYIYLLEMSNHIFKFIFKTLQYPFVASLCWYVYFEVFFKKKKHDFARIIFSVKKFQEWGQNVYFWVCKIAFQLVIFQYLKNNLTKIVHWPHYGIIIESCKCGENWNGQMYRNQDNGRHFFQITLKQLWLHLHMVFRYG